MSPAYLKYFTTKTVATKTYKLIHATQTHHAKAHRIKLKLNITFILLILTILMKLNPKYLTNNTFRSIM